jgi:hypothetical protein
VPHSEAVTLCKALAEKKIQFCNMIPDGYQKGITGKKIMKREPGHFAK